MKKINICFHINDISNCGGTEKVTVQIASLLLDNYKDYNIYILSNYCDSKIEPFFKGNSNINYDSLLNIKVNLKFHYVKIIKCLNRYIREKKIDILVGVDTILSIFDIPAIKNTDCKYIAWEHFNYNYNLGVGLRDLGRRYAAKKSEAIVVLSDKDYKNFESNLKMNAKLVRIYNPFVMEEVSGEYNVNSNIIMSSGRFTKQKGFDLLIEVAKHLKEKTADFKWIILGEGEERKKIEYMIDKYSLNDNVILKGRVSDVDEYYNQSRLFVLTSRFEGFGLVLLEAKSHLLPIVSFDCECGPSEIIKDGINGYLIENNDVESMSDKIYELLVRKDKCMLFSNNARVDINKFEANIIIEQWHKLFKDVLQ